MTPFFSTVEAVQPWLQLHHAEAPTNLAPMLTAGPAGRLIWQAPDGNISAVSQRDNGMLTITVPRIARFRASATPPIVAEHFDGIQKAAVVSMFHRFTLPMILQAHHHELLHASAVRFQCGVIALCGKSGTGKSTTANALCARGHSPWADDLVTFSINNGVATTLGLPFDFRLDLFGNQTASPGRASGECEQAPLIAIVILERAQDGVTVERLASAEAFRRVFEQGLCFDLSQDRRKTQMFNRYFDIATHTPVYRIRFPPGIATQSHLLDAIENLVQSPSDIF